VLFTTHADAVRIPKIATNVDEVIRAGTVSHHAAATIASNVTSAD
jgi:hypothetical protein